MHARIAFLLFSIKVVAAGNSLSFVRSLSVCVCAPNLNFRSSSSSSSNLHSTLLRCAKLSQEIINSCVFEPLNRLRRINIYVCAYNQRRRQRRALILLFRHNYNERPVYIYVRGCRGIPAFIPDGCRAAETSLQKINPIR